jgi:IPT/TIG domain-containing protein
MTTPATVVVQYPITVLLAPFMMPAVNGSATASVGATQWMVPGQGIVVAGLGALIATSILDATDVVLENTGATGNAAPGTIASGGSSVGVCGPSGTAGITQATLTSPFTMTAAGEPISGGLNFSTTAFVSVGSYIVVPGAGAFGSAGGIFQITAINSTTNVSAVPVINPGNAIQGTIVASNAICVVSGPSGLGLDATTSLPYIPGAGLAWKASTTQQSFDYAIDWTGSGVPIPGDGAWHTIAMPSLAGLIPSLPSDSNVVVVVTVELRQIGGTAGTTGIALRARLQNTNGTWLFTNGSSASSSVTGTGLIYVDPGTPGGPTAGAAQIAIVGGVPTLQVQSTQSSGFFAGANVSGSWWQSPINPQVTATNVNHVAATSTQPVTLTGVNFTSAISAAGVIVNSTKYSMTGLTVNSSTSLSGTLPIAVIGKGVFYVTVTKNSQSFDFISTVPFWYLGGAPAGLSVSPNSGTESGGTSVTLLATSGLTGLDIPGGSSSVTLDGIAATVVSVASDTSATLTSGAASSPSTGNVVATTPAGSGTLTNGWTYLAPQATISQMSPPIGLNGGGNTITVTGTNFTGATEVTVNGINATPSNVTATTLTFVAPAYTGAGGVNGTGGTAVNVTITTPNGTGPAFTGFYYYPTTVLAWAFSNVGATMNGSTVSALADQSGDGWNWSQGTSGYQPSLTANANGSGRSAMTFSGGQAITNSMSSQAQPHWFSCVFTAAATGVQGIFDSTVASPRVAMSANSVAGQLGIFSGTANVGGAYVSLASNLHVAQGIFGNGAGTDQLYLDGTQIVTNATTGTSALADITLGVENGGFGNTDPLTGLIAEIVFFSGLPSSTVRGNVLAIQQAVWGQP